jgi:hypothetical protein
MQLYRTTSFIEISYMMRWFRARKHWFECALIVREYVSGASRRDTVPSKATKNFGALLAHRLRVSIADVRYLRFDETSFVAMLFVRGPTASIVLYNTASRRIRENVLFDRGALEGSPHVAYGDDTIRHD